MIVITERFKKKNIKNLIKIYNIKNYSRVKKAQLIDILNRTKSAIIIQRYFRKSIDAELVCPLSLENLKYPFICILNYNKFRYYGLNDFINYLNKSSSYFKDPFTREIISNDIIIYIENIVKYYRKKKLLSIKKWNKNKEIRNEYITLTYFLNSIINNIFTIPDLTLDIIYNQILPNFIFYFQQLLIKHRANCYNLLNNYINCLNHLTHSNKDSIINYLKIIILINNL